LPTVTESAAPGEDFIPAGLAALGIEADESERCPDLSRAPEWAGRSISACAPRRGP